jgi:hypothetical protein
MSSRVGEQPLLDFASSAQPDWDRAATQSALDELFSVARAYKTSEAYFELMKFAARFRFYAPYNAMLVHIQMPGATFVAPPHHWLREYRRRIKPEARPLVILQPNGPVMFVFDVSDTAPLPDAPPLPRKVERPFDTRQGFVGREYELTVENAKRDGIEVVEQNAGSQHAGRIRGAEPGVRLQVQVKLRPKPEFTSVPRRYHVVLNSGHSRETKYATLIHELAHLYCGHLGTPNDKWWPNRHGVSHEVAEMEAESVSYLVCERLGIDSPAAEYLAGHLAPNRETPEISLECVMKAGGLIEQMGRRRLPLRKDK